MNKEQIHKDLVKKLFRENAFWSYDKSTFMQIADDVLIEKVLLNLDIDDIRKLFKLFPKNRIQRVWKATMLSQEPLYHGLNRLYSFLLFNIKNPDRYIRKNTNKRYKSVICKV